MNEIARIAEDTLRRHPHPALRLSELLELLSDSDRTLTIGRLRAILEDHPERFRILESWTGRWKAPDSPAPPEPAAQAWVVATSDPGSPSDGRASVGMLRESVRWLGRGVDGRSRMELSRWYAIALAERAARTAFLKKAG